MCGSRTGSGSTSGSGKTPYWHTPTERPDIAIPKRLDWGMLVPLIVLACTQPNDSPPDGPGSETGSETEVPCHAPPAIGAPTGQQPPVLPPPTWQAHGPYDVFSSPRLADLDGDGVLDVISGHGTDTGESELHTVGYATAHSGATGTELWRIDPANGDSTYESTFDVGPSVNDLVLLPPCPP